MKKGLFIIIPACLLIVGYVVYILVFAETKANKWDFIPEKAALVWENDNGLAAYDSVQQLGVWSAFSELSSVKRLNAYLTSLETSAEEPKLRSVFSKTPVLVAVCPISSTDLDALLVVQLVSGGARSFVKQRVQQFEEGGYQLKSRTYNDVLIHEIYHPSDGSIFSYFMNGDHLVGSFTPFLVEDAVRSFKNKYQSAFMARFPELTTLTPLQQDQGNVYVNIKEFKRLLESFSGQKFSLPGHSAFLDVAAGASSFKISGFTFYQDDFLSSFASGPVSFELLEIVPNNTAILKHYSTEAMAEWRQAVLKMDPSISEAAAQMKSAYDVDVDFLFEQVKGEFAIAELEIVGNATADRLLFFDVQNSSEVASFMRQAAGRMGADSLFVDKVGDYELIRIADPLFAQALLGKRSVLAEECYYLVYRNYVVLSNSLGQLKRLLVAIEADNTWRKSLRMNSMLEMSNREANFSAFVNTPRVWNHLMRELKPEWKPFFQANEAGFKSLEYVGVQFSRVDQKFYTSLTAYQPETPRQPAKVSYGERASLMAPLITKPFVVRSHVNQALEVLVQDSLFQLYHLSSTFEILWTQRLSAPIIGTIQPVDYFANGKYQYAFVVGGQLHIIDRTGNYVDGFPVKIPAKQAIVYFSVVDYDGSKNYRFMCTDVDGNIYLLDKAGKALDGWAPKVGGRGITTAPRHIRIAGKDAFIIMTRTSIDLVSRLGKSYQGFPLTFDEPLVGDYFPEATGSFETSKLTTLTQGGELLRVNFSGRIEYREQLVKTAPNTEFGVVPDVLENTYLILRMTDDTWEILDASGVRLFEKTYGRPVPDAVQFYRYGGGKTLLLVADRDKGFLSVFDLEGNSLSPRPIETKNLASVIYFESQGLYQLYLTQGKNVEKVRIN